MGPLPLLGWIIEPIARDVLVAAGVSAIAQLPSGGDCEGGLHGWRLERVVAADGMVP